MITTVEIDNITPFRVIDGAFVIEMAYASASFDNLNSNDDSIDFDNRTVIDGAYLVEDAITIDFDNRTVINDAYLVENKIINVITNAVNNGKYAPVNKIYADNSGSMWSKFINSDLEGYNLLKCYPEEKKILPPLYIYVKTDIAVTFRNSGLDLYPYLQRNKPDALLDKSILKILDTHDPDNDNLDKMNNVLDVTTTPDGYYILKDDGAIVPYTKQEKQ